MDKQQEYQEQRERELRPLADALTIHVRGFGVTLPDGDSDVRIENTGGDVYCVVGTLGAWTIYANEEGWSIEDKNGGTVATGGFFPTYEDHALTLDPDTGTLDPDECDAAAATFAAAFEQSLARDSIAAQAFRRQD